MFLWLKRYSYSGIAKQKNQDFIYSEKQDVSANTACHDTAL